MSYTQQDLDTLQRAMVNGERSVTFEDGRSVTFASAEELIKRIEFVRREIEKRSSESTMLGRFSKGVKC